MQNSDSTDEERLAAPMLFQGVSRKVTTVRESDVSRDLRGTRLFFGHIHEVDWGILVKDYPLELITRLCKPN